MRIRVALLVLASAALAGGCANAGNTPATAPPISTTTAGTPTSSAPTTTRAPQTTTTIDRLIEIQAIFEDLERRRLQAIYDQDEEAFRSLYANEEYMQRSLVAYSSLNVLDPSAFVTREFVLIVDTPGCIAAEISRGYKGVFETGGDSNRTYVVENIDNNWGISWVGEGWACNGPHPFSR